MSQGSEYVEIKQKPWTSKYNHQKRPDIDQRVSKILPRDRLVRKTRNYFTTETNLEKILNSSGTSNISNSRKNTSMAKSNKKFIGKNE